VPTLRLANLRYLQQNAALDLYVQQVLQHAKVVVVDHLGAESAWPYGIARLRQLAQQQGQKLALFSGDNQEDLALLGKGTLAPEQSRMLWQYLRAGGLGNARAFLCMAASWLPGQAAGQGGGSAAAAKPTPVRVLPPVAVHVPPDWANATRDRAHVAGMDDLHMLMDVRAYREKPSHKESTKAPAHALWDWLQSQSTHA